MRIVKLMAVALILVAAGCGGEGRKMAKNPASVRGWILDIEHPTRGPQRLPNPQMEAERRIAMFQELNLFVEDVPYASGGTGENGAFVILDVPPGDSTILFQTGNGDATLALKNVPANADIILPNLIVRPPGVRLLQPSMAVVRVPSRTATKRTEIESKTTIGGQPARVFEVPLDDLADRRDYPNPEFGYKPIATVK